MYSFISFILLLFFFIWVGPLYTMAKLGENACFVEVGQLKNTNTEEANSSHVEV